jgi:hypothetical protein
VTIVNKETNLTRDTATGADGSFTLNNVLPGPYDVKISLTGFREAVRTNVPVTIGEISRVNFTKTPTTKLPLNQNTHGGTVGGPISKNRGFFFGSFEGYKRDQSLFTFFTVPDARLRAGDFSQATVSATNNTQQTIYNPATGNADGTGRVPFDGNVIPSSMLDPIALKVLSLYPLPNNAGTGRAASPTTIAARRIAASTGRTTTTR